MVPRTLFAPAKINLRLKITGRRRGDGYHLLDMVMVRLDLADEIELELTAGADSFQSDSVVVPTDKTNTLLKAVDLVRRESGKKFGAKIFLKKKIPTAAGLGGGSSDAAAVLVALNVLLELGWSMPRLIEVGVKVGADVPFFLSPAPACRVTGIGERLEPLSLPSIPVILVNPGLPVSTADAYRWFDEGNPSLTDAKSGASLPPLQGLPPLENDLEKVVIPRYPVLGRIKQLLSEAGALGTLMSGSGPTVFGVFDKRSRDQGYKQLLREKDSGWSIYSGRAG